MDSIVVSRACVPRRDLSSTIFTVRNNDVTFVTITLALSFNRFMSGWWIVFPLADFVTLIRLFKAKATSLTLLINITWICPSWTPKDAAPDFTTSTSWNTDSHQFIFTEQSLFLSLSRCEQEQSERCSQALRWTLNRSCLFWVQRTRKRGRNQRLHIDSKHAHFSIDRVISRCLREFEGILWGIDDRTEASSSVWNWILPSWLFVLLLERPMLIARATRLHQRLTFLYLRRELLQFSEWLLDDQQMFHHPAPSPVYSRQRIK